MADRTWDEVSVAKTASRNSITSAEFLLANSPATRVVLISAYPDREFRRLCLNAGAVAFLDKKDLDANALRQVIEDTLG